MMRRERIVSTKSPSIVRCLNCGRILKTEFILISNDEGFHKCPCGYANYLELIGDYLWRQRIVRAKAKLS
jgi:lysyl-tRNA synthetase class I